MIQVWKYVKEPAGMGEWVFCIYYLSVRFAYCADEWQAMQMVYTLNRGERCTCR